MTVDLDHLHPTVMRPRVEALLADPEAVQLGIYIVSGYRDPDYQNVLYQDAIRRYGSPQAAGKWVAPPWHSDHGPVLAADGHRVPYGPNQGGQWGGAVDIGIPGYQAVNGKWPADIESKVVVLAARHGLFSPMSWEDWHLEPIDNWTPPAPPAHKETEMMTLSPSWAGFDPNGRAPFYQLVTGSPDNPNSFNVISWNAAGLDRVDGVFNGLWYLHQDGTTGPAIGLAEVKGVVVVLCAGGGVYRVADLHANAKP